MSTKHRVKDFVDDAFRSMNRIYPRLVTDANEEIVDEPGAKIRCVGFVSESEIKIIRLPYLLFEETFELRFLKIVFPARAKYDHAVICSQYFLERYVIHTLCERMNAVSFSDICHCMCHGSFDEYSRNTGKTPSEENVSVFQEFPYFLNISPRKQIFPVSERNLTDEIGNISSDPLIKRIFFWKVRDGLEFF